MKQRWQRVRPVMWTLIPIVGVAMLFLLPWLVRELRPLNSDALFQEARAELGATRALSPKAAAVYVRALVHAGDADKAQAFVQSLPQDTKPCVQHELIRALIDTGELNRALPVAREHLRMGNYQHCWSGSNNVRECLYWYLADELLAAGRLEDAWTVIGWIRNSGSSYRVSEPYKLLVRRMVEVGRVDLALQALQEIDADYTHAETLLVVQALLEQRQAQRALDFLSRQIRRVRQKDDTVRLPAALEATVRQAAQLARAGRANAAAQLAEQTLQRYLRTHTERTVSYDTLYTLAARFTEHLPAATMERILRRLPTDKYECAATHLRGGYIIGLFNAGRWSDLVRVLETPSGHSELPHIPHGWLIVAGYLQAGKVEQAQAWLQASPAPDPKRTVREGLQGLRQRLPSLTPEASDAIERLAIEWVLGVPFLFSNKIADDSARDTVVNLVDFAVNSVIVAGSRRRFGDAATLTAWSMREGVERTLNDALIYEAAFYLGLDHPKLDEMLRATDADERDIWRAKGLAAVAQAGRLEDAEAALRAAPLPDTHGMEIYQVGYAVGLAKRGRFREAVRMARRLPYAEYRVHALANIAAELKRRGM